MLLDDPRVREGLRLLQAREWYAAHDALEAAWLDANGDTRRFLQGMIHAAVSFEHLRRGNPRGASSQWQKAREKLGAIDPAESGIDVGTWVGEIAAFYDSISLEKRVEVQRRGVDDAALPPGESWPIPRVL